MNREIERTFCEEITRYRNALLFCAKKCEWDTFRVNAGKLFDYVEAIEMSEIERKFLRISKVVIFILILVVIFILEMNTDMTREFLKIRENIILLAFAGCCFELFFFINFMRYMKIKIALYKKRRERFIINIESDFKDDKIQMGV
ncbi:MAG: hypothetical protein HY758_07275 [Nitrospirae bacterium]|nr:hypothetical protein [Nitrospirota bacterium]